MSLRLIKQIIALVFFLMAGSSLATIYGNYAPAVDARGLSIIISVATILGFLAFFQKKYYTER